MKSAHWLILLALASGPVSAPAGETIPPQRAKQIFEAAPAQPQVTPKQTRRVLIWITPSHLMEKDPHKGYCIPYGVEAFKTLGEKTGAYNPTVSGDLALLLPENIRQFDAIVMNNSSGDWITPTDADMARKAFQKYGADKASVEQALKKSVLDYVRNGGGIAAIHYAVGANRRWPEFHEMLGATFTGHPWNEEVGIAVEESGHPVVAAFEGKNFRLADEIYEYGPPFDREKVRVLLSLDTTTSNMGVKWIHRKDNDFALAWVTSYGQGRVFCTSFGHRTEIYWHPAILRFYLDAVQFAAGDLEAPTASRGARTEARSNGASGFASLFNGRDLSGWEGDTNIWSVRDGVIVGQTSEQVRVTQNQFLIWQGGQPKDFEIRLKYKLEGGNSGIYFHSEKRAPGPKGETLVGPQADMSADHRWTGVLMEWTGRDVLAERGQRVVIDQNGRKEVVGSVGEPAELLKSVRNNDWNDYDVLVRGESVILKINGVTMCEVTDHDPRRPRAGFLALQVHTGPAMKVSFKDIQLKTY